MLDCVEPLELVELGLLGIVLDWLLLLGGLMLFLVKKLCTAISMSLKSCETVFSEISSNPLTFSKVLAASRVWFKVESIFISFCLLFHTDNCCLVLASNRQKIALIPAFSAFLVTIFMDSVGFIIHSKVAVKALVLSTGSARISPGLRLTSDKAFRTFLTSEEVSMRDTRCWKSALVLILNDIADV